MTERTDVELSPVKRALLEIRDLRAQIARRDAARAEPIAIVGMGMRFPGGVHDANSFESLLWGGVDAIGPIPAERWSVEELYDPDPDAPGKMVTRYGGFLDSVDRFDAEFFGIAPREAESMDPQQRLLLELAWTALEDAGCNPAKLSGSQTGVFVGICNSDYGRAQFAMRQELHVYSASGSAFSVAAGRISYFLGLHGPSVALDTACSSSLAAVHFACQSLRLGECERALVGGVNLILGPEANIGFSKAGMMARDGRCKTFDAAADGYVRSEGCAMIVLRRLSDALESGDRILAVIRGSALNQDGRSGGLTAPNGPAQEAVLRAALAAANVRPRDVGYIEAHGTGTPLGDPIEVGAIGSVFSADRSGEPPLAIGSVKSNIGHLEAAAGIAGLIKVVLMLDRRQIPPSLHFVTPSPHMDWARLPLTVPTATQDWGRPGETLIAGVSSFGFSGTNAHVILASAPPTAQRAGREPSLHLLPISARDDIALRELTNGHRDALAGGIEAADACFTAATGRAHFKRRLAVIGADAEAMRLALGAHLEGRRVPAVAASEISPVRRPRIAFLFTGFGVQQAGMGRQLYDSSSVFREAIDECARSLADKLPAPLTELLFPAEAVEGPLDDPARGHPTLFAVEYALAKLWMSWGIEPSVVLGHSLGEYVAACIAGVLRLDDALSIVAERGRLSGEMSADGAMLAVLASEGDARAMLGSLMSEVTVAAYNAPENIVLSGPRTIIADAAARLTAKGVETKPLRVAQAFHSPAVEPVLEGLRRVAASVPHHAPEMELVSNATGAVVDAGQFAGGEHWARHMRSPVRFEQSLQVLARLGVTHCIEIGPHPVLSAFGSETLGESSIAWLPSLRRNRENWPELLATLQRLYVDGADVDWASLHRESSARRVSLPAYPFQRKRFWSGDPGGCASTVWSRPDISVVMERQAQQGPLDLDAASFPGRWESLARLTSAHAVETLRGSRLFVEPGERLTVEDVLQRAGIGAQYRHLVHRWLEDLVGRGLLKLRDGHYVSDSPLPDPSLGSLWEEVQERLRDDLPLLNYVRRCGGLVSSVLTGRVSPLETLFPEGGFELAENLYRHSAGMRYVNAIAAAGIETLAASVPQGRLLRVLEVGAGTGGTTASILPRLRASSTRYVFTDVSPIFLDRARDQFSAWPFVEYRLFDVERESLEQGLDAGSFDVILAANAVHATRDLRAVLRRLRSLLAPGGTLMLVESTQHHAWFDMTTGLIEGWQRFDDGIRGDNPLLRPEQWAAVLLECGFVVPTAFPAEDSLANAIGQHVLSAQAPGDAMVGTRSLDAVIGPASSVVLGARPEASSEWAGKIAQASSTERRELLRDLVREHVATALKVGDPTSLSSSDRLMDLGMDSLMAVQLRNGLARSLALPRALPATLMFDHPTIGDIAEFLAGKFDGPRGDGDAHLAESPDIGAPLPMVAAEVMAMSDDDIARVLDERLGGA